MRAPRIETIKILVECVIVMKWREVGDWVVLLAVWGSWLAWQTASWLVWAVGFDGCTKSGCGGWEMVRVTLPAQAVMTLVSCVLVAPLAVRPWLRVWRQRSCRGDALMAAWTTPAAFVATWLVTLEMAYSCCGHGRLLVPPLVDAMLFGAMPALGLIAMIALSFAFVQSGSGGGAKTRIAHDTED